MIEYPDLLSLTINVSLPHQFLETQHFRIHFHPKPNWHDGCPVEQYEFQGIDGSMRENSEQRRDDHELFYVTDETNE